jgi:hypothetical protein
MTTLNTNTSIVDYLKSTGQASDYTTRASLAQKYGISNYTGSYDQNIQLLNLVKGSSSSPITVIAPPASTIKTDTSDVGNVSGGVSLTIPPNAGSSPDMSSTSGAMSYWETYLKEQQAKSDQAQKDWDAQQKTYQEQSKSIWDKLQSQPTQQQTRDEYFQSIGVNPADYFSKQKSQLAEVQTLQEDYNNAVAQKELQLSKTQESLAPMSFITAKMSRQERDANIILNQKSANINTKLGVMEAEKGNFTEAQNYVNQAVQQYTYDLELQYKDFEIFRDMNKEVLDGLDSRYINALNSAQNAAQQAYEIAKSNTTDILNLMLKYPGAGITINDTIENATKKASKWYLANPNWDKEKGTKQSTGFSDSEIEADFREDGASLKLQVRAGGLTMEEAYAQLRDLYSPSEVNDQAIKDYLGMKDTASETTTEEQTKPAQETFMVNQTQQGVFDYLFGGGNTGSTLTVKETNGQIK